MCYTTMIKINNVNKDVLETQKTYFSGDEDEPLAPFLDKS